MIDTHCHLQIQPLADNLTSVLSKAKAADVDKIIVPTTRLNDFDWIENHVRLPGVYFGLGIHPSELESNLSWSEVEKRIIHLKKTYPDKIVSIGEIGIDLTTSVDLNLQIDWFVKQVNLSLKLNLPILIHNQKAKHVFKDLITKINSWPKAVFHAFIGKPSWLEFIFDHGFYIGLGGISTYPSFNRKNWLIIKGRLNQVVLETDSPYLLPTQLKGKQSYNQPANVKIIQRCITNQLALDTAVIEATIIKTTNNLFGFYDNLNR